MLSEKQDAYSILYWLNEWQRSGAPIPKEAITDDSKALISAAVRSFSKCSDLKEYKEQCFLFLVGEANKHPSCYIRTDVAHFIKTASRWKLWKIDETHRLKDFYMRCLGFLITAKSLNDFEDCCVIYLHFQCLKMKVQMKMD